MNKNDILRILEEILHEGNMMVDGSVKPYFRKGRRGHSGFDELSYRDWALRELFDEMCADDRDPRAVASEFTDRMARYAKNAYRKDIFEIAEDVGYWVDAVLCDIYESAS